MKGKGGALLAAERGRGGKRKRPLTGKERS